MIGHWLQATTHANHRRNASCAIMMTQSESPPSLLHLRLLHEQQRFAELLAAATDALTVAKVGAGETAAVQVLQAIAHQHLGQFAEVGTLSAALEPLIANLDADAQTDWAALLILRDRIEAALRWLDAVLNVAPAQSLALARRAWCRMALGDVVGAEADMAASLTLAPQRLGAWLLLARLRLMQADGASAASRATDAQPAITRARDLLTEQKANLPEVAVDGFARQLDELQLACWLDAGQIEVAQTWVEALDETDARTDWHSALALGLAQRDQHAAAEEHLRRALKHAFKAAGELSLAQVPLLLTLAELAEVQGHQGQAVLLIRQAIAKDEANPQLWAKLAQMSARSLGELARQAAQKAVALAAALEQNDAYPAPRLAAVRLSAKLALAEVESQAQHHDAADALFREVLAEQPDHVDALRALGVQELQRGHIEAAIALFERVKAIDPVSGHTALINARRFPEDAETLVHLERAARQPSLEGPVRSGLLFQLAAAWEKRKDYAKAFACAAEANELSKRFLDYDAAAHRQSCARIRHGFGPALYQHRRDCGHPSTLPVFVLGMPRSGTTLVEQIIAGHSQIFGAGELGVIPQRIAGLNRWERHVGSGRHYPDCVDDLSADAVNGIAEGILKELREYAAQAKPNVLHVVDKLPHNFENIGLIKFFFPNARIISVRRDPRDIAISNFFTDYAAKHGGMGFAYDLGWIGEQLADHNLLMHHWQQTFPGEILEVQYEDVVSDTEAMARKMLDYIGVAWEEQVLNFNELDRPVKTASVWQVRQPIYTSSTAKWKRYEPHLAPLIAGTNGKINWMPIEMLSLPEPGLLQKGVALYKTDQIDAAEYEFKKLLHHIPEHAAASHMVGIISARKGHLNEAITLMEKSLKACPWSQDWRKDLVQALEMAGFVERAQQVKVGSRRQRPIKNAGAAGCVDAPAAEPPAWAVMDKLDDLLAPWTQGADRGQ